MTDGTIHQVSAEIGGLKANVENLRKSVETMVSTWQMQEQNATAGRRVIHDKLDLVQKEVTGLSAEVKEISKDFTEIKPAINEFKSQREQQIGAKKLGARLVGALTLGAGAVGWGIHEAFNWIKPHP